MEVLFLRHAHAVDGFGHQDEHRWLSVRGRDEALDFGRRLAARPWRPTRVCASPKVRAVQTCELVLGALGPESLSVEAVPELAYGTTASALSCLDGFGDEDCVLLVGHEPLIRSMASHLVQVPLPAFSTATGVLVSATRGQKPVCEHVV